LTRGMTSEQLADVGAWCSVIGLGVGLFSLAAALWAAWSATGAKDAAIAARRAVEQERGRDELLDLLDDAGQLAQAIRAGDSGTARVLAARLSERHYRWQLRSAHAMGLMTEPSLGRMQVGLRRLADSVGAGAPAGEEHARLAEQCAAYVAKLAARAQQDLDHGVQEDR